MTAATDITTGLVTGGVVAAVLSVVTAVIQVVGRKGVSRAEAADRVTEAAGNVVSMLTDMGASLRLENKELRQDSIDVRRLARETRIALAAVTDLLDGIIPFVTDRELRLRARNAVEAARLALQHSQGF